MGTTAYSKAINQTVKKNYNKVRHDSVAPAGETEDTSEPPVPDGRQGTWLTVGMKLILGVGLVSSLCMGILLFSSYQASRDIDAGTARLLALNAELNGALRERVALLLDKYLKIPDLLKVAPEKEIEAAVRKRFTLAGETQLKGRTAYGALFKRKQRRDLSKGGFVVAVKEGRIMVARGMFQEGEFTDAVRILYLESADPSGDSKKIQDLIRGKESEAAGSGAVEGRISELKAMLADEGVAAEKDRTKIIYHLDRINAQEDALIASRRERQQTMVVIAGVTMAVNLLVLYLLSRFIVEGPLKRLARTVEQIKLGQRVDIPCRSRKDRIGKLAGVLVSFQDSLEQQRIQERQKEDEQAMVEELILDMTHVIGELKNRSQAMKSASFSLHELAGNTSSQSDTALAAISRTEENTMGTSRAVVSLRDAVTGIRGQVEQQNGQVAEIHDSTCDSLGHIRHLGEASKEIEDIVSIVNDIAGRTRLLALNARIEAARAGAAGRGFTVVAGEVRDLSIQTESANREIEARIRAIQNACKRITGAVQGIDTLAGSLSGAGERINDAVVHQQGLSDTINRHADEAGRDIHDLFQQVKSVRESAAETRALSEGVRTHAADMDLSLDSLLAGARKKLGLIGKNRSLTLS